MHEKKVRGWEREEVAESVMDWAKVKQDQAKDSTRRCSRLLRSIQPCGRQRKHSLLAETLKCMWSRGAASLGNVSSGTVGLSHVRHKFRGHPL